MAGSDDAVELMKRRRMAIVAVMVFIACALFVVFFAGCGGGKKSGGGGLVGVSGGGPVGAGGAGGGTSLGLFQMAWDPKTGQTTFSRLSPTARLLPGIQPLTDIAADAGEASITFCGPASFVAAGAVPPATCGGGGVCGVAAGACGGVIANATLRANVTYRNTGASPIYETKAVFLTWTVTGTGLNTGSGGFGSPITITSTQITPNTQTFSNPPNGFIDMQDALAAANSSTRLWIFNAIDGSTDFKTGFLLMEYQWRAQTSGTTVNLNSIFAASGSVLYAVGAVDLGTGQAVIRKSTDGGATWVGQTSGTANALRSVACVPESTTTCWAVGDAGTILKTTNGGTTWTAQTDFSGGRNLTSVSVIDVNNVYIAGDRAIGKTTNGGTTWTSLKSNIDAGCVVDPRLNAIDCIDDARCWAVGRVAPPAGIVCRTSDDGVTWNRQTPCGDGTTDLQAIDMVNSTTGWLGGRGGLVCKTTDSGGTWSTQAGGVTGRDITGIAARDTSNVYMSADSATILRTLDGGTSWITQVNPAAGANLTGITASLDSNSNKILWISGTGGTILVYK